MKELCLANVQLSFIGHSGSNCSAFYLYRATIAGLCSTPYYSQQQALKGCVLCAVKSVPCGMMIGNFCSRLLDHPILCAHVPVHKLACTTQLQMYAGIGTSVYICSCWVVEYCARQNATPLYYIRVFISFWQKKMLLDLTGMTTSSLRGNRWSSFTSYLHTDY